LAKEQLPRLAVLALSIAFWKIKKNFFSFACPFVEWQN